MQVRLAVLWVIYWERVGWKCPLFCFSLYAMDIICEGYLLFVVCKLVVTCCSRRFCRRPRCSKRSDNPQSARSPIGSSSPLRAKINIKLSDICLLFVTIYDDTNNHYYTNKSYHIPVIVFCNIIFLYLERYLPKHRVDIKRRMCYVKKTLVTHQTWKSVIITYLFVKSIF